MKLAYLYNLEKKKKTNNGEETACIHYLHAYSLFSYK